MKKKQILKMIPRRRPVIIAALTSALFLAGCGSGSSQTSSPEQEAELKRLRQENEEISKLRAENKELPRLRRDNQEIERLKGSTEEIARIRLENESLQRDLTGLTEQAKRAAEDQRQALLANAAQATGLGAIAGGGAGTTGTPEAADPNLPLETDEILIEPRLLSKILPDFDFSKLERKEPVAVKALLDQQGIVLTNYQQLIELGITNYIIQKDAHPAREPVGQ